jgi:flagellar assembly factor FliW
MTLPVRTVDPTYELTVAAEDLCVIGLPEDCQPGINSDVLCVAIVTVSEDRPATVNLLAPLVVSLATRRGVQAIQAGSSHSHRHELPVPEPEAPACL